MELEQVKPNKPSFSSVVALFVFTLIAAFVAVVIVLIWRSHAHNHAPFTKHPTSELRLPVSRFEA